jgi:hypothetical protein
MRKLCKLVTEKKKDQMNLLEEIEPTSSEQLTAFFLLSLLFNQPPPLSLSLCVFVGDPPQKQKNKKEEKMV